MSAQSVHALMERGGAPSSHLLIPLAAGFGATLEHLDYGGARYAPESIARAARREADLLKPDLLVLGADPSIFAEACGCPVRMASPYRWAVSEAPLAQYVDDWYGFAPGNLRQAPAFGALLAAIPMLRPVLKVPFAVMLPGPMMLAMQMAGQALVSSMRCGDGHWETLLDATLLAVTDAVKLVLAEGSLGVMLYEDLEPVPQLDMAELAASYGTCFNVLRHHGLRCLLVVEGRETARDRLRPFPTIVGVVEPGRPLAGDRAEPQDGSLPLRGRGVGPSVWSLDDHGFRAALEGEWTALTTSSGCIYAPIVPADASPERVQAFVSGFKAAAHSDKED